MGDNDTWPIGRRGVSSPLANVPDSRQIGEVWTCRQVARHVADKMAAEAKAFAEFLQKANDTEKSHLRLEVEKFRRGESQWLAARMAGALWWGRFLAVFFRRVRL